MVSGRRVARRTLAAALTITEIATDSGLDPQAYLTNIFTRVHDYKIKRIDELLRWNSKSLPTTKAVGRPVLRRNHQESNQPP
ncbi:transposase domain-containing protein [Cereibacter sphaeroides f. sp. denitrificans]|nr:hypothetical protein DWF04_06350 [Cereibacter sphaeroides f. sp. denitrificans]